jgi:hypothetical protein
LSFCRARRFKPAGNFGAKRTPKAPGALFGSALTR